MARTKNRPDTAPSAAHAAPDPAPAPGTAPGPDDPAAAVCAALAANPGGTVSAIAAAAGTGRPVTRTALLEMEEAGTATRTKGGRPGIPDTWTLADPVPGDATADPEAGQPAGDPGTAPDDAIVTAPADGTEHDGGGHEDRAPEDPDSTPAAQDGEAAPDSPHGTAASDEPGEGDPAQGDRDPEADGTAEAGDSGTGPDEQPESHADASADDGREDPAPDEQALAPGGHDGEAAPDEAAPDSARDADGTGGTGEENAAPEDGGSEPGDAPDPALVSEIAGRIAQIRAAADAAAIVLAGGGDLRAALAGLEEIREEAAQARRSVKAATSGRKAPAARPGALRDKVLAHLVAHPGKEFTPHEIHKVLGHSSGAIANALETLVKHGEAEVATEKPRRFRRAAQPDDAAQPEETAEPDASPGTDVTDDAGSAQDEGTELEGAA